MKLNVYFLAALNLVVASLSAMEYKEMQTDSKNSDIIVSLDRDERWIEKVLQEQQEKK